MGRQKRQAARRRTRQAGQPRANALPARARPPSTADGNALLAALGTQVTAAAERAAFMMALNHLHEHLGQSVAYARMNGVVPPWSTE